MSARNQKSAKKQGPSFRAQLCHSLLLLSSMIACESRDKKAAGIEWKTKGLNKKEKKGAYTYDVRTCQARDAPKFKKNQYITRWKEKR